MASQKNGSRLSVCPELGDCHDKKSHHMSLVIYGHMRSMIFSYCPSKRDRAYHTMASDMSARPHEILNLKIKDTSFKQGEENIQYAEVFVAGKTKSRTLPLIFSIPYVKDWLQDHPFSSNPEAWLFVSLSKKNSTAKLTHDALLKHYKEQFRDRHFP
jgi:integrase